MLLDTIMDGHEHFILSHVSSNNNFLACLLHLLQFLSRICSRAKYAVIVHLDVLFWLVTDLSWWRPYYIILVCCARACNINA